MRYWLIKTTKEEYCKSYTVNNTIVKTVTWLALSTSASNSSIAEPLNIISNFHHNLYFNLSTPMFLKAKKLWLLTLLRFPHLTLTLRQTFQTEHFPKLQDLKQVTIFTIKFSSGMNSYRTDTANYLLLEQPLLVLFLPTSSPLQVEFLVIV